MENIKEHRVEYFILLIVVAVFLVLISIFRYNKEALLILSGSGSLLYILWGITHNIIRGKLTRMVAYEYILFGILIFLLFYTVLSF